MTRAQLSDPFDEFQGYYITFYPCFEDLLRAGLDPSVSITFVNRKGAKE